MAFESDKSSDWPPAYFAVLQDGDGEGNYYRASAGDETGEQFAERIGKLVARDIEYRGTILVDIVAGESGQSDDDIRQLAATAFMSYQQKRRQDRQRQGSR
jgi:hypothetical protein